LRAFVEAALLTSRGPVPVAALAEVIGGGDETHERVREVLEALCREHEERGGGIRVEAVGGGWRCVTPPELDDPLRSLHGLTASQRLSQAALEVLAIVAHRQPVTLPEINFIRGANSTRVARTLLDRRLIRIAGRKRVVGKPFLYRTTGEFLVHFGLESLAELPDPEQLMTEDSAVAE
jgi:segregation and condensation protein B